MMVEVSPPWAHRPGLSLLVSCVSIQRVTDFLTTATYVSTGKLSVVKWNKAAEV